MICYKEWLEDACNLQLEKLKKRNRNLSQWELDQVLFGLVLDIFTPTSTTSTTSASATTYKKKYWFENVDPIMRFLTVKLHASPFYKHPRYFKSCNDIVTDFLASEAHQNQNKNDPDIARMKKIALFFKTHFRLQVANGLTTNPEPRGTILPSKHIMTKELHSMLETLERWDQNVSAHCDLESIRIGKLTLTTTPHRNVQLYRLVINDVLFWLEKWMQRYTTSGTVSESSSSLQSAIQSVMMMDSEIEDEKNKWLDILKTLNKWYSYGSLDIVTPSVLDALQKTNDEQANEMIRLDREVKRLEELTTYNSIDLESDTDVKEINERILTLEKDKLALDYRSESLHELVQMYKVSNKGAIKKIHFSAAATSWPEKSLLRKIDSSSITLQNQCFPVVPGIDIMYKCVSRKKQQKFWILMPVNKEENSLKRMQDLAEKYLSVDSSYFTHLIGYIDDSKMLGLMFERGKTTLEKRLSPDFSISFFESRKKFHVSFQERLFMCHKLLQGYLTSPSVFLNQDENICLKNVMIKQDHGIWIAKWILVPSSSSFSSSFSFPKKRILFRFGMLMKQILEWRLCPDPDPENPTHAYKHLWSIHDFLHGKMDKEHKGGDYDINSLTHVIDKCFLDLPDSTFSLEDLDLALVSFKRHYLFF